MGQLTEAKKFYRMTESTESEVIKAVVCDIPLGESVLDAYMLPSGEKRIGSGGVGIALGRSDRWFSTRSKRAPKWLKDLQGKGFQGDLLDVKVIRQDGRGTPLAKTLSLRDFVKLVTFEAISRRNINAIVLLAAFAETGLERILEDAFAGRSIDFLLDKIVHYREWTYEQLEEVLQYNREDARSLYSWEPRSHSSEAPPSLEL